MLYLVDKPLADVAFRAVRDDPEARVVLLQDGVLLTPDLDVPTYAIRRDADSRGIELPDDVEPISYDDLVGLVFEHEVTSFI